MAKGSMFVGMDVHIYKESIDISLADEGREGEVRHYGGIPGDPSRTSISLSASPRAWPITRFVTVAKCSCSTA